MTLTPPSGARRHYITIQRNAGTVDGAGQPVDSWETVCKVWADIRELRAFEIEAAAQRESKVTRKIVLRYRSGITEAMRVLYRGRVFNIESVVNVGEHGRTLELMVNELA